ncbi:hypothetical protein L914_14207, partial [Phytophthora nicotianae]
ERERSLGSYAGIDGFVVYLQYTRSKSKEHFKRYKDIKADESVADETVYLHKKDGFHKKRGYSIFVYLSMAKTVINVLANQTDKPQWQQCQCIKCMYRRSPEWRRNKPDGIPLSSYLFVGAVYIFIIPSTPGCGVAG